MVLKKILCFERVVSVNVQLPNIKSMPSSLTYVIVMSLANKDEAFIRFVM
jgi:hypothetical protein